MRCSNPFSESLQFFHECAVALMRAFKIIVVVILKPAKPAYVFNAL